jgi:hypothetical protein
MATVRDCESEPSTEGGGPNTQERWLLLILIVCVILFGLVIVGALR